MSTATCPAIGCDEPTAHRGYCYRHYRRRLKRGEFGKRPSDDVRAHIAALRAKGWSVDDIARAAQVAPMVLWRQLRGQPHLRTDLAARVLAVPVTWRESLARVPTDGTRRRCQALAWLGWTLTEIADRSGVPNTTLQGALYMRATTTARVAARVAALYDELSGVPGPSRVAAGRARARGHAPPAAWDEDTIDDPRARPRGVPRPIEGSGMTLTYLSLFSGIGGLDLGLDRAGMDCVGQVEIDEFCRDVLAAHWPEVPRHDDVRTAPTWWASQPRPQVDVVAGGPPCQPFSRAGRQLGTADERWAWPWMRDMVEMVGPRYVLLENVAALLHDYAAFGRILGDLADLGFDAEWSVLSACTLGAPHPRHRVFVVAYPRGQGLERARPTGPATDCAGWPPEPDVARLADGVPSRLVRDPIHAYGNAVVPRVAEFVGGLIVGHAAAVERAA